MKANHRPLSRKYLRDYLIEPGTCFTHILIYCQELKPGEILPRNLDFLFFLFFWSNPKIWCNAPPPPPAKSWSGGSAAPWRPGGDVSPRSRPPPAVTSHRRPRQQPPLTPAKERLMEPSRKPTPSFLAPEAGREAAQGSHVKLSARMHQERNVLSGFCGKAGPATSFFFYNF